MPPYMPIIGTLGYVMSPDGARTLLVHRNARATDVHFEKYNGLGGKMRSDEDVVTCMRREIQEEAGITCEDMTLRGTINWTGFGPNDEDWLGFIFRIDRFRGTPSAQNDEGILQWVPVAGLLDLPMWEGDRYFLPMVFDEDPRLFHGYMPYHNGKPVSWKCIRL